MALKEVDVKSLGINPFTAIGDDWMLVTAGDAASHNTMTASWGGLGVLWGAPVATCYIRQSRYTKEFVDNSEYYTLTFLQDGHLDALGLMGSKSGRDMDKMHESGLTPVFVEGQPTFEEAELVLICRKRGVTDIAPDDMAQEVQDKWYGDHDYHTMYIGEIVAAYEN